MRISLLSLLVVAPASGFSARAPHQSFADSLSGASTTTTTTTSAPLQPARVVPPTLPVVYVYDHCPFCVRVRAALGLKNIKHQVCFMANDDVTTPTELVGKKIAPILQYGDVTMAESLDIIDLLDQDPNCGPTNYFQPDTGRSDLKAWQKSVRDLLRVLQRPRYVATGLLPEFQQVDGRNAFIQNHPLPGYEKADWKAMPLADCQALYNEAMGKDPSEALQTLNAKLIELDDMIFSSTTCSDTNNLPSYDDIDLFARLRSITLLQGVVWPQKLRAYMDYMSITADVPLYDAMAL